MASSDDKPRVSVCMLAYNQERYVAQAINSVLEQQTDFSFELVIGEDCSTDSTREIVCDLARRHPEKIRLILAERNQGAKANFMRTFNECRGTYLAILECDDYWTDPLKLQTQVDALDANPNWAICFHPARCVVEGDLSATETYPDVYPVDWTQPVATIDDVLVQNFIPTAGALFRNGFCPQLPDWFVDVTAGDWALHILNAAHGDIGFLPKVMCVYRVHSNGIWSGRNLLYQTSEIFKLMSYIDKHFEGKYSKLVDRSRLHAISWVIRERDDYRAIANQTQASLADLQSANTSLLEWRNRWERNPMYRLSHVAKQCGIAFRSFKRNLVARGARTRISESL